MDHFLININPRFHDLMKIHYLTKYIITTLIFLRQLIYFLVLILFHLKSIKSLTNLSMISNHLFNQKFFSTLLYQHKFFWPPILVQFILEIKYIYNTF